MSFSLRSVMKREVQPNHVWTHPLSLWGLARRWQQKGKTQRERQNKHLTGAVCPPLFLSVCLSGFSPLFLTSLPVSLLCCNLQHSTISIFTVYNALQKKHTSVSTTITVCAPPHCSGPAVSLSKHRQHWNNVISFSLWLYLDQLLVNCGQ